MRNRLPAAAALLMVFLLSSAAGADPPADGAEPLKLQLRTRVETAPDSGRYHALVRDAQWDPARTAIIICDMWDDHYCRASARRVAEMAPHMNRTVDAARRQGVLIIHCPSGCMDQYEGTPQRERARQAPKVETETPLESWCYLDPERESPLPIDDSEPCDDENPREAVRFFTRQIETLEIKEPDAITDGVEAYYLMKQRGIENAIIMGVHTNMCVLGRPFGIRQLVRQGMNVALMRDMTDAMYDPRMAPYVNHFTGVDLVVEHIEKHRCPTVTSADLLGGEPFRFPNDKRPRLAIVIAEDEYKTDETLPPFALNHLGKDFQLNLVYADADDRNDLPGLEVLRDADIALLSIRRRALPKAQLDLIRQFAASGKPLVAIRTSSHAFCLRSGEGPEGSDQWPEFDREVLGGYYQNHHGNQLQTFVRAVEGAEQHPIRKGVPAEEFRVFSSLYRSSPLADTATPLMVGRAEDVQPHEPVAWTNQRAGAGRVFYTSLGHRGDFELPAFQTLLRNGVYWAAGLPVPDRPVRSASSESAESAESEPCGAAAPAEASPQ